MSDPLVARWIRCKESLGRTVGPEDAATWVPALELVSLEPGRVVLGGIPNAFFRTRIRRHFEGVLRECLASAFEEPQLAEGVELELRLATGEVGRRSPPEPAGAPAATGDGSPPPPAQPAAAGRWPAPAADGLLPGLTFETFLAGACNRPALSFARQVAEAPGQRYNPLLLAAPSGLGKTHLLQAIGHAVRQADPRAAIVYCTAQAFANDVWEAIRLRRMKPLRERYRTAQVLLVDDLTFLLDKARAQEELLHTLEDVVQAGGQAALGADRLPAAMDGLNPALRSRIEAGLIAELEPPEPELRLRLVEAKARAHGVPLAPETVRFLAERITTSPRQIEGALVRIAAYASMLGEPATPAFVERVVAPLFDRPPGPPLGPVAADVILGAVCDRFGITMKHLRSKRRTPSLAAARRLAIHLLRELGQLSFPEIGAALGDRSHSTVLQSLRMFDRLAREDVALRRDALALRQSIEETAPRGAASHANRQ